MKPEFIIDEYGTKIWRMANGQIHREDGPAIESSDGTKYWYVNGAYHREDGPAIEYSDGSNYWFINNEEIIPEENLIKNPETEDEMLAIFNQNKFVKVDDNYYYINRYIKEFRKEWYEKYRLFFK